MLNSSATESYSLESSPYNWDRAFRCVLYCWMSMAGRVLWLLDAEQFAVRSEWRVHPMWGMRVRLDGVVGVRGLGLIDD